jgi:hypothetical protein
MEPVTVHGNLADRRLRSFGYENVKSLEHMFVSAKKLRSKLRLTGRHFS